MNAEDPKRRNLGRGLAALFGDENEDYASLDKVRLSKMVPIEHVRPNAGQPRKQFSEDSLQDLEHSIREQGVIQPIVVRRIENEPNVFEIVAGERRWRAAQRAQLHEVPVIIKELSDLEALEVALVENIHRDDLTPLEEAEGYRRLMEEFGHTQEVLANAVGKSRSHVANTVRLLGLPDDVKSLIGEGSLSAGHARALLGSDNPTGLAQEVVRKALNVRQTERLVKSAKQTNDERAHKAPTPSAKDPNTSALERDLSHHLGMAVSISTRRDGGSLTIRYQSLEQLDDILQRLSHVPDGAPVSDDPEEEIVEI